MPAAASCWVERRRCATAPCDHGLQRAVGRLAPPAVRGAVAVAVDQRAVDVPVLDGGARGGLVGQRRRP